jgi:hypothetical protein
MLLNGKVAALQRTERLGVPKSALFFAVQRLPKTSR